MKQPICPSCGELLTLRHMCPLSKLNEWACNNPRYAGKLIKRNVRFSSNGIERKCRHCKEWKPANRQHFYPNCNGWQGLSSVCRDCEKRQGSGRKAILAKIGQRMTGYWRGACAYCGKTPVDALTTDHFIPLSDPDTPGTVADNLLPCCQSCNSSKHDANPIEWLPRKFGDDYAFEKLGEIAHYFELVEVSR